VIAMVGGFHVAAALTAERFPGMATTLHTIGTVTLGGGIALAGQIFNLDEHWPSGILMWAIGAGVGWLVLRQVPQLVLAALLVPAWLVSEWMVATDNRVYPTAMRVAACGVFLCALAYLSAVRDGRNEDWRRALFWIGSVALLPASLVLAFVTGLVVQRAGATSAVSPRHHGMGNCRGRAAGTRHLPAWQGRVDQRRRFRLGDRADRSRVDR
jgi:uncharacterized membrane protein